MGRDAGGLADALGAGLVLPACTVAGFLGGRWLGRLLSLGETAAYFGGALGVVAGFWNLMAMLRRFDRRGGGD
jgi:hypothetical protein